MIDLIQWTASIGLWKPGHTNVISPLTSSSSMVTELVWEHNSISETTTANIGVYEEEVQVLPSLHWLSSSLCPLMNHNSFTKNILSCCHYSLLAVSTSVTDDAVGYSCRSSSKESSLLQHIHPTAKCGRSVTMIILICLVSSLIFLLLLLSGNVELNPGPGNSRELLRIYSTKLIDAITANLTRVTNGLYAKGLIPLETKNYILTTMGVSDDFKASRLVSVIEGQLKSSADSDQYLIDVCRELKSIQYGRALNDIVNSVLQELVTPGQYSQSILVEATPITGSCIPEDVVSYCKTIKNNKYKKQPIIARDDWPPRTRQQDFYGQLQLALMEECREITIDDIFDDESLRVVIDGPPGIGKTTLCRKLCNMWADGHAILNEHYDLVLYCPLRDNRVAQAKTTVDLLKTVYQNSKVGQVSEWMDKTDGERVLIIFDGWDELNTDLRDSSLAASIFSRNQLTNSSVLITSRSYVSHSLLELNSLIKHVQVIGFNDKEIVKVIQGTLANDSELARNLIHDLQTRGDVLSLCNIPLVCSMVILVYKKNKQLPTTLNKLYENFILQTIKRHVKKTTSINPTEVFSLDSLPSTQGKAFREICQFAYLSLKENKIIFSPQELRPFLNESVEENYLGLMTTFTEYDDKIYQFLHLSIQEFLAAWWIVKDDSIKTETAFKEHFEDNHFRMCLRFVAGQTQLRPEESYQEHFNKSLDLQCRQKPLFGFKQICLKPLFYQNPEIEKHEHINLKHFDDEWFPIFRLQLLYESQNTGLCQTLAQSIVNQSLCLHQIHTQCLLNITLSPFDTLCLSYFIRESKTIWKHLHLGSLDDHSIQVFTQGLTINNYTSLLQCERLEVRLGRATSTYVQELFQPLLMQNIQECYCQLDHCQIVPCKVLLDFLVLPHIKVLHLDIRYPVCEDVADGSIAHNRQDDKYRKIIECLEKKRTLQEMKLTYKGGAREVLMIDTVNSLIKGVAKNKTITSLTINLNITSDSGPTVCLPNGTIEHLLKENHTLEALKLYIPDDLLASPLNITQVNTPLKALEFGGRSWDSKRLTPLMLHNKGLQCLVARIKNEPYPLALFHVNPTLRYLSIPIDTSDRANDLFEILKKITTTLIALKLDICEGTFKDESLHEVLVNNDTLQYLDISTCFNSHHKPDHYMCFLLNTLEDNDSLKGLNISIPLYEQVETLFQVICQKRNLTELGVSFRLHVSYSQYIEDVKVRIMTKLFYRKAIVLFSILLQYHTTIRLLKIECPYIDENFCNDWMKSNVVGLYEMVFRHPSIEYIEIRALNHNALKDIFREKKQSLIELHNQQAPSSRLPIVEIRPE